MCNPISDPFIIQYLIERWHYILSLFCYSVFLILALGTLFCIFLIVLFLSYWLLYLYLLLRLSCRYAFCKRNSPFPLCLFLLHRFLKMILLTVHSQSTYCSKNRLSPPPKLYFVPAQNTSLISSRPFQKCDAFILHPCMTLHVPNLFMYFSQICYYEKILSLWEKSHIVKWDAANRKVTSSVVIVWIDIWMGLSWS